MIFIEKVRMFVELVVFVSGWEFVWEMKVKVMFFIFKWVVF